MQARVWNELRVKMQDADVFVPKHYCYILMF